MNRTLSLNFNYNFSVNNSYFTNSNYFCGCLIIHNNTNEMMKTD